MRPMDNMKSVDIDVSMFNSEPKNSREAIANFESALLELPQIKLEAKHYIGGGMYARELVMPKGSAVTGKIHIKEHICHISYGDVTVRSDDGVVRLVGPCTFIGKPGSKRALYMHEDTMWTAFHVTNETTVEACEATLVTNSYEEFLKITEDLACLTG